MGHLCMVSLACGPALMYGHGFASRSDSTSRFNGQGSSCAREFRASIIVVSLVIKGLLYQYVSVSDVEKRR